MSHPIRRRHIVVSLTLFVLLAALCGINAFRRTGTQQLNQRLADLRDQGYPTTLDDLEALHRIPEGADNAAPLYLQAIAQYAGSTFDLPQFDKQLPPRRRPYILQTNCLSRSSSQTMKMSCYCCTRRQR